jgi:hypothetical protein
VHPNPPAAPQTYCIDRRPEDTVLNFTSARVLLSNLGGFEDPTNEFKGIMYADVGINPATGRSIGIYVSNSTEYIPYRLSNNGLNGDFGQINLGAPVDWDGDGVADNGVEYNLVELVFTGDRSQIRTPSPPLSSQATAAAPDLASTGWAFESLAAQWWTRSLRMSLSISTAFASPSLTLTRGNITTKPGSA